MRTRERSAAKLERCSTLASLSNTEFDPGRQATAAIVKDEGALASSGAGEAGRRMNGDWGRSIRAGHALAAAEQGPNGWFHPPVTASRRQSACADADRQTDPCILHGIAVHMHK